MWINVCSAGEARCCLFDQIFRTFHLKNVKHELSKQDICSIRSPFSLPKPGLAHTCDACCYTTKLWWVWRDWEPSMTIRSRLSAKLVSLFPLVEHLSTTLRCSDINSITFRFLHFLASISFKKIEFPWRTSRKHILYFHYLIRHKEDEERRKKNDNDWH